MIVALSSLSGCRSTPRPGDPLPRRGEEISIAGQLFSTGTRVVLWNDPGGYDAYRAHRWFSPDSDERGPSGNPQRIARFGSFRRGLSDETAQRVRESGWALDDVRDAVRQVVIHYDVCGTSRHCFKVLHDMRGLSCHFLLDLDGTIYQTLDLKERAWHAGIANDHSIGIEIANIGAYSSGDRGDDDVLSQWYGRDEQGPRVTLPAAFGDGGLPADFIARPSRPERIVGSIHGRELQQYDFTDEQYRAEKLSVALCRTLPRIRPRVPRDDEGRVLTGVIEPAGSGAAAFEGLIGHWHVTTGKVDPGPAFDWDRILRALDRAGLRDEERPR